MNKVLEYVKKRKRPSSRSGSSISFHHTTRYNMNPDNSKFKGFKLHSAIFDEDLEKIKKILNKPGEENIFPIDNFGRNTLHLAASTGNVAILWQLLNVSGQPLPLHLQDDEGATPLHRAIDSGYTEAAEMLLEKGCPLDISDSQYGDTCLHLSIRRQNHDLTALLLKKGANPDIHNHEGDTPLMETIKSGFLSLARLLLRFGAGVTVKGLNGETPLMIAIEKSELFGDEADSFIEKLLDCDADPEEKDSSGKSALEYAYEFSTSRLIQMIESYIQQRRNHTYETEDNSFDDGTMYTEWDDQYENKPTPVPPEIEISKNDPPPLSSQDVHDGVLIFHSEEDSSNSSKEKELLNFDSKSLDAQLKEEMMKNKSLRNELLEVKSKNAETFEKNAIFESELAKIKGDNEDLKIELSELKINLNRLQNLNTELTEKTQTAKICHSNDVGVNTENGVNQTKSLINELNEKSTEIENLKLRIREDEMDKNRIRNKLEKELEIMEQQFESANEKLRIKLSNEEMKKEEEIFKVRDLIEQSIILLKEKEEIILKLQRDICRFTGESINKFSSEDLMDFSSLLDFRDSSNYLNKAARILKELIITLDEKDQSIISLLLSINSVNLRNVSKNLETQKIQAMEKKRIENLEKNLESLKHQGRTQDALIEESSKELLLTKREIKSMENFLNSKDEHFCSLRPKSNTSDLKKQTFNSLDRNYLLGDIKSNIIGADKAYVDGQNLCIKQNLESIRNNTDECTIQIEKDKDKLNAQENKIIFLEVEKMRHCAEIDKLKNDLCDLQRDLNKCYSEKRVLKNQEVSVNKKVSSLQKNLLEEKKSNEAYQGKLKELTRALDDQRRGNFMTKEQLKTMELDLKNEVNKRLQIETKIQKIRGEKQTLDPTILDLRNKVTNLQSKNNELSKKIIQESKKCILISERQQKEEKELQKELFEKNQLIENLERRIIYNRQKASIRHQNEIEKVTTKKKLINKNEINRTRSEAEYFIDSKTQQKIVEDRRKELIMEKVQNDLSARLQEARTELYKIKNEMKATQQGIKILQHYPPK